MVASAVRSRCVRLLDRGDPAFAEIRAAIAEMVNTSPLDRHFPGFMRSAGPIAAISAGGYRIEVEEISLERAMDLSVPMGTLYVFGLISPAEQEAESFELR
jgi:hypothetical protein